MLEYYKQLLTGLGGLSAEYSTTSGPRQVLKIFFNRSMMTLSEISSAVKRDGSETTQYSNPSFSRFIQGWIRCFMNKKATLSVVSPSSRSFLIRACSTGIWQHSSVVGSAFHFSLWTGASW